MGVFETLARVCSPEDLPVIREGIRRFLEAAGGGADANRPLLQRLADRLAPFERRYLPALNRQTIARVPCDHLVMSVGSAGVMVNHVTRLLSPKSLFILHSPTQEPQAAAFARGFREAGAGVKLVVVRGERLEQTCDRVLEIVQAAGATRNLAAFPGDGSTGLALAVVVFAQRLGIPLVYAESEEYAGVPRPFSLRLEVVSAPTVLGAATAGEPAEGSVLGPADLEIPVGGAEPSEVSERGRRRGAKVHPITAPQTNPAMATLASEAASMAGRMIVTAFNDRDYQAALRMARTCAEDFHAAFAPFHVDRESLVELIAVFEAWDRFAYAPAVDNPERKLYDRMVAVVQKLGEARSRITNEKSLMLSGAFLRTLQNGWKPGFAAVGDPARAVDLLAAASRRRARGHVDEAVICFQRAMFEAAIVVLKADPFRIESATKPNYNSILNHFDNHYALSTEAELFVNDWGRPEGLPPRDAPLDLISAMALLRVVGEKVRTGAALAIGTRFHELLTKKPEEGLPLRDVLQNHVYGRGSAPVVDADCERMEKVAQEITSRAIGPDRFRQLLGAATHPSLNLPEAGQTDSRAAM